MPQAFGVDSVTASEGWLDFGSGWLFTSMLDAIVVAEADTARIALWNPAASRLFGLEPDEALQRSLADQIAYEGLLVVAPDLTSGFGPKGGNFESFPFPDEAMRAVLKVPAAEAMRRYKAAYDYAMKLPRSNGKIASL